MNNNIKYLIEEIINFNPIDYNEDENNIIDHGTLGNIIFKYFPKNKKELVELIYQRLQQNIKQPYLLDIDTSLITDMNYLFSNEYNIWYQMRESNLNLSEIEVLDLSTWDTSNVKRMDKMFYNCRGLKKLNLSSFDTFNVYDMTQMFADCESLEKLDLSNFKTNNLKKVECMFQGCFSLTDLDISSFDTSNIKDMNGMFRMCHNLITLDLSNFNTSNVINMNQMFQDCNSLKTLDISNFDISNVKYMAYMFCDCMSLYDVKWPKAWNKKKLINVAYMYANCDKLKYKR